MDIKVFISSRESVCSECGENLGRHAWIMLEKENRALCLTCADLDHLVFLPSGDAALTRRSTKHSILKAVVLKWSRARNRYERQGVLVEENALQQAEAECLEDADVRARRNERAALRREELDQDYIKRFAGRVRELFPKCPPGIELQIAEHACQKYSGRVGRSAGAKNLDEKEIGLAVIAHIRHTQTNYDELLAKGYERAEARSIVNDRIDKVLESWRRANKN